jgi:hypothetical protein
MRRAKAIKRERRDEERRLPERLATVREVNHPRAQYGTGPVVGTPPIRQLVPGERCHYPTVPLRGAKCPQCGWVFGKDIEPQLSQGEDLAAQSRQGDSQPKSLFISQPSSDACSVLLKAGAEGLLEHLLFTLDENPVQQECQRGDDDPGSDGPLNDSNSRYNENHSQIHRVSAPSEGTIGHQGARLLKGLDGGVAALELTVRCNVERYTGGDRKKPHKAPR